MRLLNYLLFPFLLGTAACSNSGQADNDAKKITPQDTIVTLVDWNALTAQANLADSYAEDAHRNRQDYQSAREFNTRIVSDLEHRVLRNLHNNSESDDKEFYETEDGHYILIERFISIDGDKLVRTTSTEPHLNDGDLKVNEILSNPDDIIISETNTIMPALHKVGGGILLRDDKTNY